MSYLWPRHVVPLSGFVKGLRGLGLRPQGLGFGEHRRGAWVFAVHRCFPDLLVI